MHCQVKEIQRMLIITICDESMYAMQSHGTVRTKDERKSVNARKWG